MTLSTGQDPVDPSAATCLGRLKQAGFTIEAAPMPPLSNQGCQIDEPVKLRAIPAGNRETPLRLASEPVLACRFAESLGRWLGDLAAPVIAGSTGSEVAAVHTGPGFQCRNRNRLPSGKLSAHAEGLAIDISDFELANGSRLTVKPGGPQPQQAAIDAIRRAACGWFTTILGPGSDAAHADHLHVDIQLHGSSDRYRICQ